MVAEDDDGRNDNGYTLAEEEGETTRSTLIAKDRACFCSRGAMRCLPCSALLICLFVLHVTVGLPFGSTGDARGALKHHGVLRKHGFAEFASDAFEPVVSECSTWNGQITLDGRLFGPRHWWAHWCNFSTREYYAAFRSFGNPENCRFNFVAYDGFSDTDVVWMEPNRYIKASTYDSLATFVGISNEEWWTRCAFSFNLLVCPKSLGTSTLMTRASTAPPEFGSERPGGYQQRR
mmetsp:Transcript_29771/g.68556  ORF Transcript_29771/g.68556 Transcript_29771/m.68556 type:complete len:234 (-) Transcript_29771:7-708(-)